MKKLLLALGITVLLSGCKVVADIVISDADEKQVGLQYYGYLCDSLNDLPAEDPRSQAITTLGKALAKQQERRNFTESDFTFTVIDDDVVNAFALPGGYIFIYTGLLNKVANSDQVAGVIAHEIGHVAAEHYKEVMLKSSSLEVLSQIVGGKSGAGELAKNVGKYLINMKMSRNNEYQADSLSVAYVAKDGTYSPWGMKSFLDTLNVMGSSGGNMEILTTHPSSEKRAEEVTRIINDHYSTAKKEGNGQLF